MYVIRTNSRGMRTYKSRRDSFKVAWEGSGGCGAKKMKKNLSYNKRKPSLMKYANTKGEKEIQLAYTDGWKDTAV